LRDGQRLLSRRRVEYRSHPRSGRRRDSRSIVGQFQFSSSASSAVSAAVRGGPVKIVYTNLSRPSYTLVSIKPDITSAKELVGKKIAINSFGDTGHLATILYLKKMGVNPSSVLFIAVGETKSVFRRYVPAPSTPPHWCPAT